MSLTLTARGKHTAAEVIAQLRSQVRDVEMDNRLLVRDGHARATDLHTALIRGCQDAMLIAHLRAENTAVKAANEEWRRKTVRAQAEQERLRRAVVAARPKLHPVPTDLVRPFAPVVELPYVSPVPYRSTANDDTQQLPVLDQPEPAVWPVYAMPATA